MDIVNEWKSRQKSTDSREIYNQLGRFPIDYLVNDMAISDSEISENCVVSALNSNSLVNFTGPIKTCFVLRNSIDALRYVVRMVSMREKIDIKFIKYLHRTFNKSLIINQGNHRNNNEKPGEWKTASYTFGLGSRGCSPEDVQARMVELVELMSKRDASPLKLATVSHCVFEQLHPFAQGNGRVGRLLMNALLLKLDHPPIVIFKEDYEEYINSLHAYDVDPKNVNIMYSFLRKELNKTWSSPADTVHGIDSAELSLQNLQDNI